jgi:hypothetical protein
VRARPSRTRPPRAPSARRIVAGAQRTPWLFQASLIFGAHDQAPHPAYHRRRYRRLQEHRARPAAAQGGLCRALRHHARGRAVRDAADAGGAVREQGLHQPVRPEGRGRDGAYPVEPRGRPGRRRAGDSRSDGEDGERDRRRPCHHPAAGDRQAGARGARDECAHVAARGDAAQCRHLARRWRHRDGARRGGDGVRRIWAGTSTRAAGDLCRDRGGAGQRACRPTADRPARFCAREPPPAARAPHPDHCRADARADRPGAL